MLKIYGASDDLVELEGIAVEYGVDEDGGRDLIAARVGKGNDELDALNACIRLEIGTREATEGQNAAGVRVVMSYASKNHDAGVWGAEITPLDEDVPIPWPVSVTAEGYSVVVNVDAPDGTPVKIEKVRVRP